MPGWDQYPIRDDLEKRWGCPVSLNNDAEMGALGEWAAGAGRGEGNLAYIKVRTGIGAGLLLAALPTLLVYIFLGRYFLRGLLAGSLKG